MATTKEIKKRIKSIRDTQKITNAMYLIASTKLRKAKNELDHTRPYFIALQNEIKRIFRISEEIENRYFYPPTGEHDLPGSYGYLVITADKGLAGAYNQNVIKKTLELIKEHENPRLFVVGQYGCHYFASHGIPTEQCFLYTAQNPTISRAREIATMLLDLYNKGELSKIYIIYTDMKGAIETEVKFTRLLPFHRADFIKEENTEKEVKTPFEFKPSIEEVLDGVVPSYLTGYIYSALVDSFCSEQNSRMNSMDAANRNAQELIDQLTLQFNHIRQSAITQEITEVAAGARSMKKLKHNSNKGGAAKS